MSSPTYRIVGKGKVHNFVGLLLHNHPFPQGYLEVSVEICLDMDALLPIPDSISEVTLVRDAIGAFVAWPIDLIVVGEEVC